MLYNLLQKSVFALAMLRQSSRNRTLVSSASVLSSAFEHSVSMKTGKRKMQRTQWVLILLGFNSFQVGAVYPGNISKWALANVHMKKLVFLHLYWVIINSITFGILSLSCLLELCRQFFLIDGHLCFDKIESRKFPSTSKSHLTRHTLLRQTWEHVRLSHVDSFIFLQVIASAFQPLCTLYIAHLENDKNVYRTHQDKNKQTKKWRTSGVSIAVNL